MSSFDDETKADDDATIDSQKFTEPKSETNSGSRIGPYHLRQKIGEGGMGEVWLAEQSHPIKRKVALKIIKSGMDSKEVVSRFEAERQALALMDHPYVAKIYDAGTTPRGRPYFAMEYVQGTPITEHCDRHKLNVSERLELFRQVCEGVQHAHQKAIIHRDLKPGNVLVAEQDGKRAPSIIDFGVAKATAQKLTEQTMFTQLGALIGTPEYMSPEQAEMTGEDVDTRTDVYSLGVILYELLAGALPFDPTELREGGFEGIRLMIREKDPQLPSTRLSAIDEQSRVTAGSRRTDLPVLQRQLKGDLDWITMRALEKDRTRRYASPNEFAADVRRYLEHEPVLASPPSTTYRVKKFVRRNRGGVMAASLVLAALVLGMVGTTVGLIRATRAESHAQQEQVRAEEEAERANREAVAASTTARFLVGMFEAANPYYGISRGNEEELTAREVLDSSVERLDETLADQPETRAQLQVALGSVYVDLSLYDQAEPLLLDALEYYQAHPDDSRGELAHVQGALASLLNMVNRPEEAEPFARESVALYRELGDDPESLAFSLMELAHPPFVRGDYPEAEPLYREALTLRRGVLGSDHIETANTLMNFGYMLFLAGKVTEGEEALEEAIAILREYENGSHPWLATALNNAAIVYRITGRDEEKLAAWAEAADVALRTLGPEHSETQTYQYNYGIALLERGQTEEGEKLIRLTLESRLKRFGPKNTSLLGPKLGLARVHQAKGEFEAAEQAFAEAIALAVELLGPEHLSVGYCRLRHASMLHESGKLDRAEQQFLETIAIFEGVVGSEHVLTIQARRDLGHVLVDLKRLEEAEVLVQAAIDYYSREFSEGDWQMTYAECILAGIESARGRHSVAEPVLVEGLASIETKRGHGSGEWRLIRIRLVSLYQAWGKSMEAEKYLPAH